MQKLRALLPEKYSSSTGNAAQRHSISLEPEIGFQISIESSQHISNSIDSNNSATAVILQQKTTVPELNVNLIAARHLPALFGFKIVQGYLIKVKLFPGSKRLDSSIQTNSWPKFNENFRFSLAPDIKSSLKHSSRRGSRACTEFTPEELFSGHFVVFTVYALLELPPASFNRFNKTYRSLRDKSSNFVQKIVESSSGSNSDKAKDDKENATNGSTHIDVTHTNAKSKRKSIDVNPRDPMPPLTISESRRNIGSVTCYLEPKIFKRNPRSGLYSTEELWLPIKDITTTVPKVPNNNLANSAKGVVEIILEMRDYSEIPESIEATAQQTNAPSPKQLPLGQTVNQANGNAGNTPAATKSVQWNRMTSEVKRKMGLSNNAKANHKNLVLRITTARMRCSNKVKDELESTAGSVYVKTTIFEHGIYIDSWKSPNFYPSLSTKWEVGDDSATVTVPLQTADSLENILIRTTLATKTKMGKKLVLGTVLVGGAATPAAHGSGLEHIKSLQQRPLNERVPQWHAYQ